MEANFDVEKVFEHEYLVRAQTDGEMIESRIRVELDVLEQLGLQGTDEQRIVKETAVFLAGHQPIIDFPAILDLTDLIASYEDYAVARALSSSKSRSSAVATTKSAMSTSVGMVRGLLNN